jgi:hypothetical protein
MKYPCNFFDASSLMHPGTAQVEAEVMSDSYIIEVRSEPAGIIVRDRGGFRFFAATEAFHRMEGQYFRSAREAEREALAQDKLRREGTLV